MKAMQSYTLVGVFPRICRELVPRIFQRGDESYAQVSFSYCESLQGNKLFFLSVTRHAVKPKLCAQLLGRCIKDLPREEVFVATKVGKYIPGEDEDFSADRVTKSVHESLKRLQLDYIDLIHCHDVESAKDMKQVRYTRPQRYCGRTLYCV